MKRSAIVVLSLALVAPVVSVSAQHALTIDLYSEAAHVTGTVGDATMSAGLGIGGTAAVAVKPRVSVYGGWDWMHFKSDYSFAGGRRDFEETGFDVGLRYERPIMSDPSYQYRLEGGALIKHVQIQDESGGDVTTSSFAPGFEVGAGLSIKMENNFHIVPAIRYRSSSPSFTIGSTTTDTSLRYVSFELGFSNTF
jgi:opacity protein-like surface antigen